MAVPPRHLGVTFSPDLNDLTHSQATYAQSNAKMNEGIGLRYRGMAAEYARGAEMERTKS